MRKVLCSERFGVLIKTEAVTQRCSVKMMFLETSQNSHENTCARVSLFRDWNLKLYLKRDSGTAVFMWILRNYSEHFFFQNTSGGCFCNEICLWGRWNPSIKTKMVLFLIRVFLITNYLKVVYLLSKTRLSITVALSFCLQICFLQGMKYAAFIFSLFSESVRSFKYNISSFCVCHHCYCHCALQYVLLFGTKNFWRFIISWIVNM